MRNCSAKARTAGASSTSSWTPAGRTDTTIPNVDAASGA